MCTIGFMDLNVWWLGDTTDPIETAKQQMQDDGYWDDCEITDAQLEQNLTIVSVDSVLYNQLKIGYTIEGGIRFHREEQLYAAYTMLKQIATANSIKPKPTTLNEKSQL
jgi:hypothetical protein